MNRIEQQAMPMQALSFYMYKAYIQNNWFVESMFFVGVHWMEFVSHVKFRQLQKQR
jgi:hypothetical protein